MGAAILPVLGSAASLVGAIGQQSSSKSMAREQMRFQERMSSTAHQREVADLRKAGLNPLLSINSGADGAGGAMGEAQNVAGQVVSSAQQAAMMNQEMKLVKSQVDKVNAEKESVDLDNFRKEVWMGTGRAKSLSGHGIVDGIPASSALAGEISSARAAGAASTLGLSERSATAEMWNKLGDSGKGVQFILPLLRMLFGGR